MAPSYAPATYTEQSQKQPSNPCRHILGIRRTYVRICMYVCICYFMLCYVMYVCMYVCMYVLDTRFLKKWCGLAATTNPSILYLPEESFGLSLPKLSTTFQSITSCNLRYLLQSKDPMVQQLAEAEVHHQQQLCNRKFVPATLAHHPLFPVRT